MVARQLFAIAVLPFTVTVLVPSWIARQTRVRFAPPAAAADALAVLGGMALLAVGVWLFAATLQLFWTRGRGTLAPWDPPRVFVAEGPYRRVRNPMITGVLLILVAEALILRSRAHAEWAALFTLINAIYIPLVEEPGLEARFGESYRAYKRRVPRFIPRPGRSMRRR